MLWAQRWCCRSSGVSGRRPRRPQMSSMRSCGSEAHSTRSISTSFLAAFLVPRAHLRARALHCRVAATESVDGDEQGAIVCATQLCSPVDVTCAALFVSKVLLVGSLVVWYCAFCLVSLVAVMRDATPLQRVCCARARARAAPPKGNGKNTRRPPNLRWRVQPKTGPYATVVVVK